MDLAKLTIAQAREELRSKRVSAEELMRACVERSEAVDGKINAIVYKNFDAALAEAKKVDAAGSFDAPLAGIPYLTKDVYCEEGVPTTACSNILREKDYRPPFDSTTTKRLKAAGAISMGKVNTDEFTMGASTETSCYGVTRNPWDTTRVAGGSSGGSAASVAADECIFSLGTDTCGSIRFPAAFCGCTGMRTTYGRTSRFGVMSMASSMDTIGPLCKTVEDIAIVLESIAGHDPYDGTTGDVPVPQYSQGLTKDIKGLRIGVPKEYFSEGLREDVAASVREGIAELEKMGAVVTDISLPHTHYALPTYYILCPSEVSSNMARYDGIRYGHTMEQAGDLREYYELVRSEGFGDEVKRRIMIGTYALSAGYFDAYYRKALKVRALVKQDFDEAFKNVDIIAAPVAPHPAFKVGTHEGDPVAMYLEDVFMAPQVMAGIPAISVPCGLSKEGLPLGLQLMGRQWEEGTVLRAAHQYQLHTDWHTKKPDLGA